MNCISNGMTSVKCCAVVQFLDLSLHTFCFACILQWADVVSSCPMCKVPFKSIIHNVRGADSYDQVCIHHNYYMIISSCHVSMR